MPSLSWLLTNLSSFTWEWPWVFVLLPLPLLFRLILPAREQAPQAIRVPFYRELQALYSRRQGQTAPVWINALLAALIWIFLVSAAARPTWIGEPVPLPMEGRDLMLAVDISRSMREEDMQVQSGYVPRITAVKAVVGDFIQRRTGDRIGLILFGQQGYLQTPLTFDTKTVEQQLQEAQLGFAGNATAIGDAIGLAVKRLRDRPAESRVLILLTDGANTAGTDPRRAAEIAAEANIRIHTIGVGADSIVVQSLLGFGRRVNPSSDLDEDTLTYIAETTGGQYFRARDPGELLQIYDRLDELEPMPEEQTFRPSMSLFHWPLAIALILSGLMAIGHIASQLWSRREVSHP
ncbi:MAG: VWA domain-containing protein [Porticoccaceae bacterium]